MDLCDALDQYGAATTLVDFYGFRGDRKLNADELEDLVFQGVVEERDAGLLVRPHVQVHEFEGLLFSDPEAFRVALRYPPNQAERIIERLRGIQDVFDTPEDINHSRHGAPSKRLECEIRGYRKIIDGIAIAKEIGIKKIGEECLQFREWLSWMEQLAED